MSWSQHQRFWFQKKPQIRQRNKRKEKHIDWRTKFPPEQIPNKKNPRDTDIQKGITATMPRYDLLCKTGEVGTCPFTVAAIHMLHQEIKVFNLELCKDISHWYAYYKMMHSIQGKKTVPRLIDPQHQVRHYAALKIKFQLDHSDRKKG